MTKKVISLLLMISVCICVFGGSGANAKEKQFKNQEVQYKYNEDSIFGMPPMYLTNNGKVQYIWYEYKKDKKNDITYAEGHTNTIDGKRVISKASFKDRDIEYYDRFARVRALDDKTLTIDTMNIQGKPIVKEYDTKGKKIFAYKDKNSTDRLYDSWDDGRNIYYVYEKQDHDDASYVFCIRCINKKSKKAKDMKSITLDANEFNPFSAAGSNLVKIEKGKIYVLCSDKINVYSLKGKLLNTCRLPDGNRTIRIGDDSEDVMYLTFNNFCVCGKYIYYCNRNGIYRWNMKGRDGFKLYYNAEGDEYFGAEYGAEDICVKDKNTIYIMLRDKKETDMPTKLVRYFR